MKKALGDSRVSELSADWYFLYLFKSKCNLLNGSLFDEQDLLSEMLKILSLL